MTVTGRSLSPCPFCLGRGCGGCQVIDPEEAEGRVSSLEYRRDSRGEVIHRADCRHIKGRGSAWPYADGMTHRDICEQLIRAPWLRPCHTCQPDVPEGFR